MSARSGALSLALAAVCAVAVVSRDDSDARRILIAAMDSEEVAAICAQSGVKLEDFWARAKAMGIAAAVLRPQSLDQAMARGDILKFSRAEIERWKAVGIIEPVTTLRPDTFWIKDARLLDRVLQAVNRQGVSATTSTSGGFHLVRVPEEAEGLALSGYDPERIAAAEGLALVFAGAGRQIGRVGLRLAGAAASGEADPASSESFDLMLDVAAWKAGSSGGSLLRRAYSRPRRLLLIGLDPALGVEGNLDAARAALRALSSRGILSPLPSKAPSAPEAAGWEAAAARAAAWLLGILGPLFAARAGLLVLRQLRSATLARWPIASPVAQLAGALATTTALAALAGLLIHALAAPLGAPLGAQWAFATLAAPLVIAALTLYTVDLQLWGRTLRRPATYAGLLKLLGVILAAALLLAPRWSLQQAGLWLRLEAFGLQFPGAWWWPWRWREILIGFPLLLQAMFLINWRLECPDCASLPAAPANDPRAWFLLGLLAPIGIVTAVGQGGVPASLALAQTTWTLACGATLGAVVIALRMRAWRLHPAGAHNGSKGPVRQ